jgi:hypothetical protein
MSCVLASSQNHRFAQGRNTRPQNFVLVESSENEQLGRKLELATAFKGTMLEYGTTNPSSSFLPLLFS